MATNEICELKIDLNVYLLGVESKEYVKRGTINAIDSYTSLYEDKFDLFEKMKHEIFEEIKKSYIREKGLFPTDIELGKKGIYVVKGGEEVQALFKNIFIKDKSIPLEAIVLNRMINGNLVNFYKCDKWRMEDPSYQSFFTEFEREMIDRLELACPTTKEVLAFYHSLKNKNRYYEALRFLLMNPNSYSMDELYEKFLNDISKYEVPHAAIKTSNEEKKTYYRSPYNDD